MVVKRKLEIPVFQEWRMKKLEPFVGIFTMVGILCLIQIMIEIGRASCRERV